MTTNELCFLSSLALGFCVFQSPTLLRYLVTKFQAKPCQAEDPQSEPATAAPEDTLSQEIKQAALEAKRKNPYVSWEDLDKELERADKSQKEALELRHHPAAPCCLCDLHKRLVLKKYRGRLHERYQSNQYLSSPYYHQDPYVSHAFTSEVIRQRRLNAKYANSILFV